MGSVLLRNLQTNYLDYNNWVVTNLRNVKSFDVKPDSDSNKYN